MGWSGRYRGVAGQTLTIAGFSEGTLGIATSITFVNKPALAALMGVSPQASSYILVRPDPETDVQALAGQLRTAVPEANIVPRADFVKSERALIRQMGTDVIQAMSTVAYMIALLVIGLTIYTATLERAREYGVLKAIGANHPQLVSVVIAQAFVAAGLGYLIGIGLAWGTAALVGRLFPEMLILIQPTLVMRTMPTLALVTALAALLPLGRIMRLDPLVAFRG
jgi:putative ABC transport system permease protein